MIITDKRHRVGLVDERSTAGESGLSQREIPEVSARLLQKRGL